MMGRKLSILFVVLNLAVNGFGQEIQVKANIDKRQVLIGDWIEYKLKVSYSDELEILWPTLNDTIGEFEIVSKSKLDSSIKNGEISKEQSFTITHFDSGKQVIGPLTIAYRKPTDSIYQFINTDTFQVDVSTVAVDTSQPIKPVVGPLKVPYTFREILPFILIFLGLALVAFLVYYFARKSKDKPVFAPKPKPKTPPHVTALAELRKLEDEKLWQKDEIKKYHIRLTDIFRQYVEDRYEVNATESTTPEILDILEKQDIKEGLREKVKTFLELSDLAKFAKFSPLPDENEKCLQIAYEFVNETKPLLFEGEKEEKNPL